MLVPIARIAVINRQREELDLAKVNELAQSITANGLLHPIVVRPPRREEAALCGERDMVLVVGGRRLAAHALLGRDEIEATLRDDLDALSAEVCELDENLKRVDISWDAEVKAKARIHAIRVSQNPLQTIQQTADEIGESKANLSKDLKLAEKVKAEPTLKLMSSKGAAHRSVDFKASIAQRVANLKAADSDDLRTKLLCMDAIAFLKTLPDASVDLVFSDLPYGIDQFENQSTGGDHEGMSKFDDSKEKLFALLSTLIPEIIRVTKPTGWICLFMCYEFHQMLVDELAGRGTNVGRDITPELPPWVWYRPGSSNWGHFPDRHAANRYEMIVVANGGEAKFTKKPLENVLNYEAVANAEKLHNHQKPHALCRELIERFTVAGELVVDICFGSGAHLAAAADLGRRFCGSESNHAMIDPAISLVSQFYTVRT